MRLKFIQVLEKLKNKYQGKEKVGIPIRLIENTKLT